MFVGLQQVIELRVDGGGAAPRGRWEERLDTLGIGGALVSSTCSEQMCREHPSIPHIGSSVLSVSRVFRSLATVLGRPAAGCVSVRGPLM